MEKNVLKPRLNQATRAHTKVLDKLAFEFGIGENERFVASDASPILRHTKQVIYLLDGDIAVLTPENHSIDRKSVV
jgi:hypothetical protein